MTAWVRRQDHAGRLELTPFQESPRALADPAFRAACEEAVHVVTAGGEVLRAGQAMLFVLDQAGWTWTARLGRMPGLSALVELGYWTVSRHRQFFSRFLFRGE
ncbi:MAG: DCC1-like thiol-disulfide oxidoreductase family protein [Myxococcota bacterium]